MVNLGLAYWHDAVANRATSEQQETLAFLARQPGFEEACRQSVRNTLERYASPASNVMRDLSSAIYGVFVLYLDARGGLTATGIHELCKELGIASLGRATAIMLHLRMRGFVRQDTEIKDRRVKRYIPTDEMKAWIVEGLRGDLLAFSHIEPEARFAAEKLSDPEALKSYLLALGPALTNNIRRGTETALTTFAERNAGWMVLWDILSTAASGDSYPPRGTLRMSVHGLSRKYKVSRTHVFHLLRDVEAAGLLKRNADDQTGVLCEPLHAGLIRYHAAIFTGFAMCAYRMLQATSSPEPSAVAAAN